MKRAPTSASRRANRQPNPAGRNARRRAKRVSRLFRVGDDERPVFAAKKAGGVKGLQFLAFPIIEALSDIDEGGDGRVERAERSRNARAEMRRGHCLRRR